MQFPTLAKLALILAAFTLSAQASPAPSAIAPDLGSPSIFSSLNTLPGPVMGYFFSTAQQYTLRNDRVTDKIKQIFANGQLDIIGVVPSRSSVSHEVATKAVNIAPAPSAVCTRPKNSMWARRRPARGAATNIIRPRWWSRVADGRGGGLLLGKERRFKYSSEILDY
ncbi:hypothetical protein C8J57DRAFT_1467198 [Mycena rebaudengoi]|nr:hypothetical protein C8J57DRAFT_1467198 [Mycena rebaudengoi]